MATLVSLDCSDFKRKVASEQQVVLYRSIIESVDSISRDGPDCPYM